MVCDNVRAPDWQIEAAEWARDRQWEDIVTLQRQEVSHSGR
jgi:hypothetical protein